MVRKSIRRRWKKPLKGKRHYNVGKANSLDKETIQAKVSCHSEPYEEDVNEDIPDHSSSTVYRPVEVLRKKINVLSLFDGISSGFCALHQLPLEVLNYYSCEIDQNALQVQDCLFHGLVIPLGSVTSITERILDNLGEINLLLGGSPCQELSLVNTKNSKGLYDPSSSGVLFFDYVRIKMYLESRSQKEHSKFFWLYENVSNMQKIHTAAISRFLKCQPRKICASEYVPMIRERDFWTNIPEDNNFEPRQPVKPLQSFLNKGRVANVSIVSTLTSNTDTLKKGGKLPVTQNGVECGLMQVESERLMGLRDHHSLGRDLSKGVRQKLIGNSWCVPVIVSILKPMIDML